MLDLSTHGSVTHRDAEPSRAAFRIGLPGVLG